MAVIYKLIYWNLLNKMYCKRRVARPAVGKKAVRINEATKAVDVFTRC